MFRLILLSLSFWLVWSPLMAQSPSRSGLPAAAEDKSSLRRFPCGGLTLVDERFDEGSLPDGWTILDLDGLTPRPEIQFLTPVGGWQLVPDFKDSTNGNYALASPAWYEGSTAPSDDWLISPPISNLPANVCLSWYAYSQDQAFPEAYEVRVSTTTPDPAGFLAEEPIVEIAAEGSSFTYRSVSLAAYAGQDIYLAFRHVSTDAFILVLDDIRLAQVEQQDLAMFDLAPISAPAGASIRLSGAIINLGLVTQDFDSATLRVSYQVNGDTVRTHAIPRRVVLLPNDTIQWRHSVPWIPPTDAVYGLKVWVESGIGDTAPRNDTLFRWQGIGSFTPIGERLPLVVEVFPNPSPGQVWIEVAGQPARLSAEVYDPQGRRLLPPRQWLAPQGRLSMDLSPLPPGLYFLRLTDPQGRGAFLRLLRQ